MIDNLTFRLLPGRTGLQVLKPGWQRLQTLAKESTYYQTYEWYSSLADSLLTDGHELLIVVAESDDDLVGIFPLHLVRRIRFGIPMSCLQFPTHSHAVLCDFLVHPSLYGTGLFSHLIDYLHKDSDIRWDMLQLARSPLGSCSDRLATEQEIALGGSTISGSISEIDCETPEKSSLSHLSGRFRRNLARLERRAARHGDLTHISYSNEEHMEEGLRLFIDIENDGWKGDEGSSIASAETLQQFYSLLSSRFSGKDRCHISMLRIGSVCVAAHFGIISSGIFYILKIGFRQQYAELGPGNLMLASTLRHFSGDPEVHTVNLVTSPEWAEKWKTHTKPTCTHTVLRKTFKGRLLYTMTRVKDWLKTLRQGRKRA